MSIEITPRGPDFEIPPEILEERGRQVSVEGWTADHDDGHEAGHLLRAAICYILHATNHPAFFIDRDTGAPCGWPWSADWWKPRTPRRDLVRAGALCLAERERVQRLYARAGVHHIDYRLRLVIAHLQALPAEAGA